MTDSPRTSRQERKIHVQAALSLLLPAPGAARWGWQVRSLSRGLGSRLPAPGSGTERRARTQTGHGPLAETPQVQPSDSQPVTPPAARGSRGWLQPSRPRRERNRLHRVPPHLSRCRPAPRPRSRSASRRPGARPDAGREPEWDAGREADGDGRREPDRDAEPRPLSRPAGSEAEQAAERGRERAPLQRHLSSLLLLLPSPPFSSLLLLLPSPPFSSPFPLARLCQPRGATAVPCRRGNGDPGQVTPSLCRGWEGCGSR